ncbi:MAG: dienelactone hydrolase family protein [Chloroflexaceae bacterium]|nr:dienelactone hydrolase family protein [Chloroflexaceae bacterium]NJO07685.1 dienelactone hydrolase family protein [Chloroflexaceae bacterium]
MDRIYVMQLVRSFQCGEISRRDFLKRATIAVGSAVAAQMLLTACGTGTGTTPPPVVESNPEPVAMGEETGLIAADITYTDEDGSELMGYLARPVENTGRSAIVVIQEWWGLDNHIRDLTRRFAREGFVALAPDLYNGVSTSEPDEARKLVMELDMVNAVREIGQAMNYLLEQEYVTGDQIGVVGFCLGGALALQTARTFETVGAAVAFYGRPLEPEQAGDVKAPVLGLYGALDEGIPVEGVRAMEAALPTTVELTTEEGATPVELTHEFRIYPGAGHAFLNDTRASYNEAAARDAWNRAVQWFRNNL